MKVKLTVSALIPILFCGISLAQDAPGGAFAGQVPVDASLKKELNSKVVKVDQEFTASTEKAVVINNTTLPKGTLLLGHVVAVTRHTKETPNGSITIVFDHAQVKKADPIAIRASVYKISLSEGQILGQKSDVDVGLRGSAAETNATAAIRGTTDQEGRTVEARQAAAGAPVHVISMVPGVALSAVASDTKSAILSADKHDVELGAGMEMVIGVAVK